MIRLTNRTPGHNKFWEAEIYYLQRRLSLEAAIGEYTLHRHWGRIGGAGQTMNTSFITRVEAEQILVNLLRRKLDNGYEIMFAGNVTPEETEFLRVNSIYPTHYDPILEEADDSPDTPGGREIPTEVVRASSPHAPFDAEPETDATRQARRIVRHLQTEINEPISIEDALERTKKIREQQAYRRKKVTKKITFRELIRG